MPRARQTEPLATLKKVYRALTTPVRLDAAHDAITFRHTVIRTITARLRTQIARMENPPGNGAAK